MKIVRRQSGAVIGLAVALSLVLVLIIVGVFTLSMILGGSREVRNAVDSGALNVGKQVWTLKTSPQPGSAESQFDELRDKTGKFGLGNINRVWAKALLVAANYQAMQNEGTGGASASSNVSAIYNAALAISDRIADQLDNQSNLHPFFEEVAGRNHTRMLGGASKVKALAGHQWQTSLVDRGFESNIFVEESQFPDKFKGSIETVKGPDGKTYLAGYKTMNVAGYNFNFVPFRLGERPHLISGSVFTNNTRAKAPINWQKPVANAFFVAGQTEGQNYNQQTAVAYVQANPQKYYDLTMRGFIRIKFDGNTTRWIINQLPVEQGSYGNHPEVQVRSYPIGTGTLNISVSLGNEYIGTLGMVLFKYLPSAQHSKVKERLLQRCRQMKQGFTMGELEALLNSTPFVPLDSEYYIFPTSQGKIVCAPKSLATALSGGWLKADAQADGTEKTDIATEKAPNFPNKVVTAVAVPAPFCSCEPNPPITTTLVEGTHNFTPGTGYDGCLGTLRVTRSTTIFAYSFCHPL